MWLLDLINFYQLYNNIWIIFKITILSIVIFYYLFFIMNKIIKIIKFLLIIISLSFIIVFFFPRETYKEFGEYAWFLLILVMFVRPLKDIFQRCRIFSFLAKFRRELWILVWVFWLAHGIGAFMDQMILINYSKSYIELFLDPYVWNYTGYMFWWILAGIVSIPLLMTSNGLSVSILWKHWKTLQRFSYIMFVLVGLHIYFIKKDIWPLIILWVWILLWGVAFIKNKKKQKNTQTGPKWFCVPCGYIYDENIWDPDGWILPGTPFEDIPEDRRCPVCGVGKSDFILLESEIEKNQAQIVWLNYLTPNVIELQIETQKKFPFTNGQFMTFIFQDEEWLFHRSYSIANNIWNRYIFLIKIKENGRAGKIWPYFTVWSYIYFTHISWKFQLLYTKNPKVFIATGTGLSPIYNMILNTPENISKKLYFWVATKKDMFYEDKLRECKNIEIHLFLSKEEISWYHFWRMDFSQCDFQRDTEFYICGNPWLVEETKKSLQKKWFQKIFTEEFY